MTQSRASFSAMFQDRPAHLIVTTAIGGISVLSTALGLVWHWPTIHHHLLAFALGLETIGAIFWFYFYWNGFFWARYFVLVTSIFGIVDVIYSSTKLHFLVYLGAVATAGSVPMRLLRLCISLYFVAWLLTSEAARYFATEARHERLSRTMAARRQEESTYL